ncbi:choline-phosphate cytidylyltransferase [Monosporozyma unispora]|nr:choline-phosphate cytidylyltransferase [Kazachstania unispora]
MEKKLNRTAALKKRLSSASLRKLFKKRDNKKRNHSDLSDSESHSERDSEDSHSSDDSDSTENFHDINDEDNEPTQKRRRLNEETAQQKKEREAFLAHEKELDEALPEELRKYRPKGFPLNLPPKDRPIRIYADGVFDLFHLGHMKQLEQCKKSFPNVTLICGVPSDKITHKLKGLTVLTDKQRCETLMHCKWVDEVVADAPWCVTPEFLAEHKIDYVAHDDIPYVSGDNDDIYKPIKEMGKFLTTQRTDGISTSDIITKIIRDYDKYLMRNFARGATRQELNVSWLKKNELEFKKHIKDFRSYFKKNQQLLNNSSRDLYFEVREILLRKTLGNNLYSKLTGVNGEEPFNVKKVIGGKRRNSGGSLIREKSPASEFAEEYTGEPPSVIHSEDEDDSEEGESESNVDEQASDSD